MVWNGYLMHCSSMLVPRQLRFSLYNGAVITEGRCSSYSRFIVVLSRPCPMPYAWIVASYSVGYLLSDCSLDLVFPCLWRSSLVFLGWLGLSYVIRKDLLWSKASIGKWAQIFRFTWVKLINPPPFETARAQSELFAFQCSQWVPIRNSQIIGRYKETVKWKT